MGVSSIPNAISQEEILQNELAISPCKRGLAVGAVANFLVLGVPGHVAFADNAAAPIEAFMATADTERFSMIGNGTI